MKAKNFTQHIDVNTGQVYNVIRTNNGATSIKRRRRIVDNFQTVQEQLDLAQNTGFRNIVCSFGKSTELNRNLYRHGALMVYPLLEGGYDYCLFTPTQYKNNGMPAVVTRIPIFKNDAFDGKTQYVVGVDCVLWYDNVTFSNQGVKPISRAAVNKVFANLSCQVLTKLAKQLEISGSRLLGVASDTSQVEAIQDTLQDVLDDEQLVQVLANNFKIDPQTLTIQPELTGYLQLLQDINQVRQYHNGFGQGAFGTFKKERNLQGEIDQNDGNTNLVHMARVMMDKEFIADMKAVFNEDVFIEWNGGNTGLQAGVALA